MRRDTADVLSPTASTQGQQQQYKRPDNRELKSQSLHGF
jgi:hypothetical protein